MIQSICLLQKACQNATKLHELQSAFLTLGNLNVLLTLLILLVPALHWGAEESYSGYCCQTQGTRWSCNTHTCNGCEQTLKLDTCKIEGSKSEIRCALQIAFIISGCTFTTYTSMLHHSLGIQTVYSDSYQDMIKYLYPIVEAMVDDACVKARDELKKKDPSDIDSWKKAVTTADGVWQTRGYHSKNFTFSVQDFDTGALLFRKHLCQKGSS